MGYVYASDLSRMSYMCKGDAGDLCSGSGMDAELYSCASAGDLEIYIAVRGDVIYSCVT